MSLPIDEIFGYANQGEGSRMGVPSIFVRTGGCNLTCSGFGCTTKSPIDGSIIQGCDSIHAVNVKHFKHTWNYYDEYMDLVRGIDKFVNLNSPYIELPDIVFTGGEPLIWYKDDVMVKTIEFFISRGHKIFFETNGTVDIDFDEYPIYKKVSFSMSVKMSSSGEPKEKRWRPDVVNNYLKNTKNSYFKFVLSKDSIDSEEREIFEFLDNVPTFGTVYVMPLGETAEEVQYNAKAVYEFSTKYGLRYSDRLHIRIYNDLRGV